jgi:hypothetical protein
MIAHPMEVRGKTIVVTGPGGFVVDVDEGMRRTEAWLRAEGLLATA